MRKRNPPGRGRKANCGKCGNPKQRKDQAWCNSCIAEWARENRKRHSELSDEQRKKANARSYLNVYIRRGKIIKEPCCVCGDLEVQAFHTDYDKPLEVEWYCRKHHLEHHEKINSCPAKNLI